LRQGQGQGAIQTVCPGSAVVGHREMQHVEIHGDFRMGIQSVHSYTSNEYLTALISRRDAVTSDCAGQQPVRFDARDLDELQKYPGGDVYSILEMFPVLAGICICCDQLTTPKSPNFSKRTSRTLDAN
jgi:hypothetical protein